MKKNVVKAAAVLLLLAALIFGPHQLWKLRARSTGSIVVLDKTVPFEKYREHENIFWLLHALKIAGPDGRYLEAATDYFGFDPKTRTGRELGPKDLEEADLLFVADTYGVYVGDYEQPGDVAALERSPKIYGGLSVAEAKAIDRFVGKGCNSVIGEFNTFASPTEDAARAVMERRFGARWTRWVARFWPNVKDENEVPSWVGRVYERVFDRPFDVEGPALIFVRDDADMVVLQPSRHFEDEEEIITVNKTERAPDDWPDAGAYYFWLDVIEATTADVLYEYRVEVNEEGRAELEAHGLRPVFPAVVQRPGATYLAGDFVDLPVELGDPERAGLLGLRRFRAAVGGTYNERFIWGWYAPLMEILVTDALQGRTDCH